MQNVLEFTEADLDLPRTQPEILAEVALAMFDGTSPVRISDVAEATGGNYGTVKTHLHRAARLGLLKHVPRKGWLPPDAA